MLAILFVSNITDTNFGVLGEQNVTECTYI